MHWSRRWLHRRRAIERYAASNGPFDFVDTPAITATAELGRHGRLVVRSVQPELRYLWSDTLADLRSSRVPSPRALLGLLLALPRHRAIVGGWRRAARIVCLGSLELEWMRRRYPRWSDKLASYVCAPSPADREQLLAVGSGRSRPDGAAPQRFLWIGRLSPQKEPDRLFAFIADVLAGGHAFTLAGHGVEGDAFLPPVLRRSGRVRLVPKYTRAELPKLLAEHDTGLFTSSVEGWGLSLNEMLESGMTVFATPAGGVPDLRPYFADRLQPFPPPASTPRWSPPQVAREYLQRFSWPAIAAEYEAALVGAA